MKIVVCTNHFYPSVGGCEIVTKKLVDYLSTNHEVTVATRRMPGRKISEFPYRILEYAPEDYRDFVSKLTTIRPDVIFVYSDVFDFFRNIITRPLGGKLIIALCGANWLYKNRTFVNIFSRSIGNISSIICHSIYDRDYRLCTDPKVANKTHVIPNGVDIIEFDENKTAREELVAKYGIKKEVLNKRWILNVSNFFPGKGQEHLVDILGTHFTDNEYHYFQISSNIPFAVGTAIETNWQRLAKSRKIKTTLLKNIPRNDVVSFFNNSNVFAFTSEKEVAPIVLLESMAARLPWVAGDVGNVRGLKGGRFVATPKGRDYHSVFNEFSKSSFASYIRDVWKSPSIGNDGRLQIEQEMTWDIILPKYKLLIDQ